MDQASIIQYVADTFAGVDVLRATDGVGAGDTFFIYDRARNLDGRHRLPFATIVTKDYGDFDNASNLNRPGVNRLNIGVSPATYRSLFGPPPKQGAAGTGYDFTALDRLLPHPVYAPQSWVCVLNPGDDTFTNLKPFLAEAYQLAVNRLTRQQRRRQ